jgi:hypothetical protein
MKRLMTVTPFYLALTIALGATYLQAHEVDTHAQLGVKAWQQSSLVTDPIVRANLGLDRLQVNAPFRSYPPLLAAADPRADDYFDALVSIWANVNLISSPGTFGGVSRSPTTFDSLNMVDDGVIFRNDKKQNNAFLQAWLMRGEIREDDLRVDDDYKDVAVEDRPDHDPYGDIIRVFHHFYDPIHDTGLRPRGFPSGTCSGLSGGDAERNVSTIFIQV